MNKLKKISIAATFQLALHVLICLSLLAQEQHTNANETLIPIKNEEGKWGYLNREHEQLVITPQYDYADLFVNGSAMVVNRNPKASSRRDAKLIGWIDESGKEIFAPQFKNAEAVETISGEIISELRKVTTTDGEIGIISLAGKVLAEIGQYTAFQFYDANHFTAGTSNFFAKGKAYTAPEQTEIIEVDIAQKLFYIKNKRGKKGMCTWKGKLLLEPTYTRITYNPSSERILASFKTTKTIDITGVAQERTVFENHLFSTKGKLITTFDSNSPAIFYDNCLITFNSADEKHLKQYIQPSKGEMISAEKAASVGGYYVFKTTECAAINKKECYGIKNAKGRTVLQAKHAYLKLGTSDFIIAQAFGNGFQYGVINQKKDTLISFKHDGLHYFDVTPEGRLRAFNRKSTGSIEGQYALMDTQGNLLTDYLYDHFYFNKNGLALVKTDFKHGLIDASGDVLIPTEYDQLHPKTKWDSDKEKLTSRTVYLSAKKDGLWGVLSSKGEIVMPINYQDISVQTPDFNHGWVTIRETGSPARGMFNIHSKIEIPPSYSNLDAYKDCLIGTKKTENGRYRYQLLFPTGEAATPLQYEQMEYKYGYILAKKDGKRGVLNPRGEVIVPFQYDGLKAQSPHLLFAYDQTGPLFYVTTEGKPIQLKE